MNVTPTYPCDAEKALLAGIVEQAKDDLISPDDRLALEAARYFFVRPVKGDEGDITTFAGVCIAMEWNADEMAKGIFHKLSLEERTRILLLLMSRGYNVLEAI